MTIQLIFQYKQQNPEALKTIESDLMRLQNSMKAVADTGHQFNIADFMGGKDPTGAVKEQINELKNWEAQLKRAAASAQALGKEMEAQSFLQRSQELQQYRHSLEEMINAQDQESGILSVLNSKFNQFGFTLFVTISTIKQITGALNEMFEAAQEGAAISDRMQAFSLILNQSGVNAQKFAQDMREASQGAIALSDASVGVLRLLKSGLPEAAAQSDQLLKIAVASATLSGELDQVETIYNKLVRGIVRGSPRLIDDADILLKLGDANAEYAASLGKTSAELTINEQKMATLNAVLKEGERIVGLAEGFDSTALSLQKFKTDAQEAGEAFKVAFGGGLATLLTGIQTGMNSLATELADVAGLTGENRSQFIQLLSTFRGLAVALITGWIEVGGHMKAVSAFLFDIQQKFNAVGQIGAMAFQIISEGARGNFAEVQRLRAGLSDLIEKTLDLASPTESYRDEITKADNAATQWLQKFGFLPDATANVKDLSGAIEDVGDSMQNLLGQDLSLLEDKITSMFDSLSTENINRDLSKKRLDIEKDFADKIVNIEDDLAKKIADINTKLQDKLADIAKKRIDEMAKIQSDLQNKLTDIDSDLADKLNDVHKDADDKRTSVEKDKNKKLEDIETDHQKKVSDIMSQFEKSRMQALIDRDARALFEAQQTRNNDLSEADQAAKQKKEDEITSYKERMEEINKHEQETTETEIAAAAKRREEAKKDAANRLMDLRKKLETERQEAIKAAADQRRDAQQNYMDQRNDALENYRSQYQDLAEWYDERLRQQQEAAIKRRLQMLKDYEADGKLTEAHLNDLEKMLRDYEAGNTASSGGLELPTGTYNQPAPYGTVGTGSNRRPAGGVIGQPYIPVGASGGQNQTIAPQSVNITMQPSGNNQLLDELLKSVTYDAVVELFNQ